MKRICLIEHRLAIKQSLSDTLHDAGFSVTAFHTASDALDQMLVETPDLVILELFLPDRDGIETLLSIREAFAGVPVLMLVAEPHRLAWCSVTLALKLGANAALQAPFSAGELNDVVTRLLDQHSLAAVPA